MRLEAVEPPHLSDDVRTNTLEKAHGHSPFLEGAGMNVIATEHHTSCST
jgi:hypothetical protein